MKQQEQIDTTTDNSLNMSDVHPSHVARALGLPEDTGIAEKMQQSQRLSKRLFALMKDSISYSGEIEDIACPPTGPLPDCNAFGIACAAIFHRQSVRQVLDQKSVILLEDAIGADVHLIALKAPESLPADSSIIEDVEILNEKLASTKTAALMAWADLQLPHLKAGITLTMPHGMLEGEIPAPEKGWADITTYVQCLERDDDAE